MCEKSGIFNSNSVPTYGTRAIAKKTYRTNVPYPYHHKKAYRTSVPYLFAKIEAYRTVPTYHSVPYCHPWFCLTDKKDLPQKPAGYYVALNARRPFYFQLYLPFIPHVSTKSQWIGHFIASILFYRGI